MKAKAAYGSFFRLSFRRASKKTAEGNVWHSDAVGDEATEGEHAFFSNLLLYSGGSICQDDDVPCVMIQLVSINYTEYSWYRAGSKHT